MGAAARGLDRGRVRAVRRATFLKGPMSIGWYAQLTLSTR